MGFSVSVTIIKLRTFSSPQRDATPFSSHTSTFPYSPPDPGLGPPPYFVSRLCACPDTSYGALQRVAFRVRPIRLAACFQGSFMSSHVQNFILITESLCFSNKIMFSF